MSAQTFLEDNFRSSVRKIFQCVGLAKIPTANENDDDEPTFVLYHDERTPELIRQRFKIEKRDTKKEDDQTIGGFLIETEMRGDLNIQNGIEIIEIEDDPIQEFIVVSDESDDEKEIESDDEREPEPERIEISDERIDEKV